MSNYVRGDTEAKEPIVTHHEECDSPPTQQHALLSASNSSKSPRLTSDLTKASGNTHPLADETQMLSDLEATRATNAAIEAEIATTLAENKRLEADCSHTPQDSGRPGPV